MSDQADILFRAEVDATGAITALKQIDSAVGTSSARASEAKSGFAAFGDSLLSVKNAITGLVAYDVAGKFVSWMADSVKLSAQAQQEQVKLEAMLRATGGAVGLTAQQLNTMAMQLSRTTGMDDELVKSAESLLLTFRNVRGDAFETTMKAAADLAAVTGMDLRAAVETLGRALEDPATGMDRLRRVGIILSEQVRAQIKDFQAHGETLKAESLLLNEIHARVGGVSDAMGGTFTGNLNKTKVAFDDVRQALGAFITDSQQGASVLGDVATVLGAIAEAIKKARDEANDKTGLRSAIEVLSGLIPGFSGLVVAAAKAREELGNLAGDARIATGEVGKLAASHTSLTGSMHDSVQMTEEEKKKLSDLLDKLDPVRKATNDYKETVALLDAALAAHEITQGQYTDALKAAQEQLDKVRQSTGLLLPEMAKLPGSNTLAGLNSWADAIRNVDENYVQLLPKLTSLAHASEAGLPYTRWIVDLDLSDATKKSLNFSDEAAKQFAGAFKDGFLTVFEGKDVASAWETLSRGFAGIFAKQLGDTVSALMQGKPLTGQGGALEAGGLWNKEGGFNWIGLLGGVGGMVGSYGMAKNNQALGALGGALSGAVTGGTAGSMGGWNWVGAIVGAIVGGAMGYFGSAGQKPFNENWGAASGANPPANWYTTWQNNTTQGSLYASSGVSKGGTSQAGLANMTAQIFEQSQNVEAALNQMLLGMKQSLENPAWTTVFKGSSTDVATDFNLFLKGQLPQAVFKAFTPYLSAGMGTLGISDDRIKQELAAVSSSSDFSKAIQQLEAYLTAVTSLQDLSKDLGATAGELRDKVNATARDQYLQGFSTAMDQIQQISGALEGMTSAQQVANAQQLLSLAQSQYQAGLQYFSQLESLSKGLSTSYGDMFAGFDEQRAREKGTGYLASYYEQQINSLMDQLTKAGSAEQMQTINQKLQQYGSALWQMESGQNQPIAGYSRTDIESLLHQAEKESQTKIAQWEQEVADKNAALEAQIDTMTGALTSATTTLASTTDGLDGLGDSSVNLGNRFDQLSDATAALAAALAQAASSAGAALDSLASSAGPAGAAVQRYA